MSEGQDPDEHYLSRLVYFFPELIAELIIRYETMDNFYDGFVRFVVDLSKKVLLANTFAILADNAFDGAKNSDSILVSLVEIAYTLQIFFDFSGNSDMAIGLGRMFGIHFLKALTICILQSQ